MILKWAKSEEKLFFRGGQCGKKLDRAPAFFLAADAHGSRFVTSPKHFCVQNAISLPLCMTTFQITNLADVANCT